MLKYAGVMAHLCFEEDITCFKMWHLVQNDVIYCLLDVFWHKIIRGNFGGWRIASWQNKIWQIQAQA